MKLKKILNIKHSKKTLYERFLNHNIGEGFTRESIKSQLERLSTKKGLTLEEFKKIINTTNKIDNDIIEARSLFQVLDLL